MEPAIVAAARNGDRRAQSTLLQALVDRWYRVCLGLLGSEDAARDATQEAALRLLRDLPRFRGDSALETWAIGIAINVCREQRRPMRPSLSRPARGPTDPAIEAQAAEWREAVASVLDDLPPRQREAIVLRYFEDMSIEESAAAMNCSPGTVKATVHQALRSLRNRLSQWV